MKEKELRRSLAVFPIGSVMKLTDLTARQIRYYEDQGLISPDRTEGNRRMYSLDDMDRPSLTVIPQLLLVIIRGYVGRTALGLLENAPHVLSYNSQREKLDAT